MSLRVFDFDREIKQFLFRGDYRSNVEKNFACPLRHSCMRPALLRKINQWLRTAMTKIRDFRTNIGAN